MEHFVIIVNGWKPLTITTKHAILDVAAVLDPPLKYEHIFKEKFYFFLYSVFHSHKRLRTQKQSPHFAIKSQCKMFCN